MKKRTLKTALIVSLAVLLFAAPLSTRADAEKKTKRTPDPMMRLIPKDALFCVRINDLQKTLASIDKFAQGLIPLPIKLAGLLEGDEWKNVVKDGSFALFGLLLEGEVQKDDPLANIFAGILMPVTDYKKLLSESPDISKPDENGISRAGGGHGPLLTRAGKFALLCWGNDYDKLVKAKKLLTNKTPGLRNAIDGAEYARAAGKPIWAYVNVQVANQTFCPFISGKIEQMKKQFKMMDPAQRGPMADPGPIIDMYAALFGVIADEIQYYTAALEIGDEALTITETALAREGTEMAEAFEAAPKPAAGAKTLAYLDDGAIMNLVFRANSPFLSKAYIRSIDLLTFFGGVTSEELDKLKRAMTDEFASLGDYLAFSFNSEEDSPFVFKYVVEIGDKAKFEKAMDEQLEMMKGGFLADLYKNFGMKIHMNIERNAEKYKGVSIDSAKLAFSATEPDSEMGKMIEAMYGDGFDYRWAIVDDLAVYVVGGDVDAAIRELIDQVKAGGPKKVASEVKAAQNLLAAKGTGDFFGTLNLVRAIKMVTTMMSGMPGAPSVPPINLESKSNLAFTGTFRNGKLTTKSALPKEHIQEFVGAFMTMQAKMAQAQAEPCNPLFNGKDLTGWEPAGGAKWVVEDGMLIGTQGENNAPGDIFTTQTFKDFELICTYRTEWPCNSGIWFRYQSPDKAYQADILEWKDPVCYSGTIYCPGKMFLSMNEDASLVNRDGWNTMKVRAQGDHLQVWLNGVKVGDVREGSTDSGKIGFQVHPGADFGPMKIVVKQILIKEL
ncbi:MAG: DUF1080 domain-containing protein [Sedimentisphaerales bacterium]|nr:DUF1080 domain-containing protein [Sedimentisphaerales bacterium]